MTQTAVNAADCSVQERSVNIRVLTVGTKQITQSLYKQLPEEPVIDRKTGELAGILWGCVNLHIDCNANNDHKHVIWEKNGQLRRSREFPNKENSNYNFYRQDLKDLATVYVCLVALTGQGFNHWKCNNASSLTLTIKDISVTASLPARIVTLFQAPERIKYHREQGGSAYHTEQIGYISKEMNEIMAGGLQDCFLSSHSSWENLQYLNPEQYKSHTDVYDAMELLVDRMNTLSANWRKSYNAIEDAGQLFVAVSGVWK